MRTHLQRLAAAVLVTATIVATAHVADAKPDKECHGRHCVSTDTTTIDSGGRSFG